MTGSPIVPRLARGERLLWSGRPRQGIVFTPSDVLMIPFSLLWGGFAFFWETMVILSDAPIFFRLWGVPFVLVGSYIIAGRFFHDAWVRAHSWYAVTDRRVLILRTGPLGELTALDIRSLPDLQLRLGWSGRGTILFAEAWQNRPWDRHASWGPASSRTPQFTMIRDAERVFDLITAESG
ncbi:hypothetical protein [Sphingomonas sp.]|uniref:hypothetical protein n=1 Tax=Sphingomonas sp. TaxID=28214 RepID=UPI001B160FB1|nr:hypothetical protein [Sphingomonas sp.]MBO9714381.1 hypothetical protein [Sphingomonas sp.]